MHVFSTKQQFCINKISKSLQHRKYMEFAQLLLYHFSNLSNSIPMHFPVWLLQSSRYAACWPLVSTRCRSQSMIQNCCFVENTCISWRRSYKFAFSCFSQFDGPEKWISEQDRFSLLKPLRNWALDIIKEIDPYTKTFGWFRTTCLTLSSQAGSADGNPHRESGFSTSPTPCQQPRWRSDVRTDPWFWTLFRQTEGRAAGKNASARSFFLLLCDLAGHLLDILFNFVCFFASFRLF